MCVECGVYGVGCGVRALSLSSLSHVSWPVLDTHFRGDRGALRVSSLSIRNRVLCPHSLQRHGIPPLGWPVWTEEPFAVDSLASQWGDGPQRPWASARVNTTCTVTDHVVTQGAGAAQRWEAGWGRAPCDAGQQRSAWGRGGSGEDAAEPSRVTSSSGGDSVQPVALLRGLCDAHFLPWGLCMPYQSTLRKSEP